MEIPLNLLDEARAGRRGPALQYIRGQEASTSVQDCQKILDEALHPAPKDTKPERAEAPEPVHDTNMRRELSGRPQRGDSVWNETLDHLLSMLTEQLI